MEPLYNRKGKLVGYLKPIEKVKMTQKFEESSNLNIYNKIEKKDLEHRLIELNMSKTELAKKINVTNMTIHNKFKNPSSFTLEELSILLLKSVW